MKPLAAILALFTITLHVMAGSVGSVVICSHFGGDSHPVFSKELSESSDCCDHDLIPSTEDCDSCVDTKFDASDLAKVPSQNERNLLKSPFAQSIDLVHFEDLFPQKRNDNASPQLSRAPPANVTGIAPHIKITVLRV